VNRWSISFYSFYFLQINHKTAVYFFLYNTSTKKIALGGHTKQRALVIRSFEVFVQKTYRADILESNPCLVNPQYFAFDHYGYFYFHLSWIPVLFSSRRPIEWRASLDIIASRNNTFFVITPPEIISGEQDVMNYKDNQFQRDIIAAWTFDGGWPTLFYEASSSACEIIIMGKQIREIIASLRIQGS